MDTGPRLLRRRGGRKVRQRPAPRHHAAEQRAGAAHGIPARHSRRPHPAQAEFRGGLKQVWTCTSFSSDDMTCLHYVFSFILHSCFAI